VQTIVRQKRRRCLGWRIEPSRAARNTSSQSDPVGVPSTPEPVSDAYIAAHCPALMSAAPYFQRQHWDATFDLGVQALIESFSRSAKPQRKATRARAKAR